MEQNQELFTVGDIAKAAKKSIGATQYRLEKLGIQPRGRIGAVRVYHRADLEAVCNRPDKRFTKK